jgi:hypothetical protein
MFLRLSRFSFSKTKQMKNCKRPVAEYARHRTRSPDELLQVADKAADGAIILIGV